MANYNGRKIKTIGVYVLTHRPTGLFYIGASGDIYMRLSRHKYQLKNGTHANSRLQRAYVDWDEFDVDIFERADLDTALQDEKEALDLHVGGPLCCNHYQDMRGMHTDIRVGVIVDGIEYDSISEAARALGVTHKWLSKRLRSKRGKYAGWQRL